MPTKKPIKRSPGVFSHPASPIRSINVKKIVDALERGLSESAAAACGSLTLRDFQELRDIGRSILGCMEGGVESIKNPADAAIATLELRCAQAEALWEEALLSCWRRGVDQENPDKLTARSKEARAMLIDRFPDRWDRRRNLADNRGGTAIRQAKRNREGRHA